MVLHLYLGPRVCKLKVTDILSPSKHSLFVVSQIPDCDVYTKARIASVGNSDFAHCVKLSGA